MNCRYLVISSLWIALSLYSKVGLTNNEELVFHVISAQPFGYIDEEAGNPTGLHFEIIQTLSERSGVDIKPVIMPYNRIWSTMETGGHDGGIVWRSAERDYMVDYLSYVWTDYLTALTLKNKEIMAYEDLQSGIEVGVMVSSSITDSFNKDNTINKVMIPKYDYAMTMLAAGRVAAVVGNISAYIYIAKQQKVIEQLSLPGFYLGHREQWLQISKKSKTLLALSVTEREVVLKKLASTMNDMVKDGTIREINRKYYGNAVNLVDDMLEKSKR